MVPVVVIRPQPGCDATVTAARELGLAARAFPMFEVHAQDWTPPDPDSFDALLIGSVNALRHGGAGLTTYHSKPAYAVGATTAREAQAAGFELAGVGEGGLQAMLCALAPGHRRLLRLSGRERTVLVPPPGVTLVEYTVYVSEPCPMPGDLIDLLRNGALVLVHSGEAAQHFSAQCDMHRIDRSGVAIAALAPRIAEAAGHGWHSLETASAPRDQALLALAQQMCQNRGGSDA